ncbi:hypothetical protein TI01_1885 [Lysobacter sp. A03]|nr:hypothetical protein TI01_1885 [Lysobacter sp. A03]
MGGHALQFVPYLLQRARDGRIIAAAELLESTLAGGDQIAGVRLAAVVQQQLGDGIGIQCFPLKLKVLVLEPFNSVADIALGDQFVTLA